MTNPSPETPEPFYTGILLGNFPNEVTRVLDVMNYRNRDCVRDTLVDSIAIARDEAEGGPALTLAATIYEVDMDGDQKLVETLDLQNVA